MRCLVWRGGSCRLVQARIIYCTRVCALHALCTSCARGTPYARDWATSKPQLVDHLQSLDTEATPLHLLLHTYHRHLPSITTSPLNVPAHAAPATPASTAATTNTTPPGTTDTTTPTTATTPTHPSAHAPPMPSRESVDPGSMRVPSIKGLHACLSALNNPVVYDVFLIHKGYKGELIRANPLGWQPMLRWVFAEIPREIHVRINKFSSAEVMQDGRWLERRW